MTRPPFFTAENWKILCLFTIFLLTSPVQAVDLSIVGGGGPDSPSDHADPVGGGVQAPAPGTAMGPPMPMNAGNFYKELVKALGAAIDTTGEYWVNNALPALGTTKAKSSSSRHADQEKALKTLYQYFLANPDPAFNLMSYPDFVDYMKKADAAGFGDYQEGSNLAPQSVDWSGRYTCAYPYSDPSAEYAIIGEFPLELRKTNENTYIQVWQHEGEIYQSVLVFSGNNIEEHYTEQGISEVANFVNTATSDGFKRDAGETIELKCVRQ